MSKKQLPVKKLITCHLDGCEVMFKPVRVTNVYCCPEHKEQQRIREAKRHRDEKREPIECFYCKKLFRSKWGHIYCSQECADICHKKRLQEKRKASAAKRAQRQGRPRSTTRTMQPGDVVLIPVVELKPTITVTETRDVTPSRDPKLQKAITAFLKTGTVKKISVGRVPGGPSFLLANNYDQFSDLEM